MLRSERPRDDDEVLPGLVGRAPAMQRLAAFVRRVAPLPVPTLVRGESGTGKELVARAIHRFSPRHEGPFVAVNAATLEGDLGASALFGHGRGAFTGASSDREGAFRRAHGGTLFIDEIGAMPLGVQAALLRAVEEGAIRPVGVDGVVAVDVRIVAATCEAIEAMVERRAFRGDLYQRLSVCVVRVPPLRERAGDVGLLAEHLLGGLGLGRLRLEPEALELLEGLRFPGNVRELRNVLVQAAIAGDGARIAEADVAAAIELRSGRRAPVARPDALVLLRACDGNVSAAARRAGLPRSTFRDLLARGRQSAEARPQNAPATPTPRSVGEITGAISRGGAELAVEDESESTK